MKWSDKRKSDNIEDRREDKSNTDPSADMVLTLIRAANQFNKCEIEVPVTSLGSDLGLQSQGLAKPPHQLQGILSEPTVKAIEDLQNAVAGCKGNKIQPKEFSQRIKSLILSELDLADGAADGIITRDTILRKSSLLFDKYVSSNEKSKLKMMADIKKRFPESLTVSEAENFMNKLFAEAFQEAQSKTKSTPVTINTSEIESPIAPRSPRTMLDSKSKN